MDKIKSWIKSNQKEFLILCFILAIGAFFRLYKINQYMTFLGDEGRDVIIVRRLLVEGHPPLIGPGTSIGNMYLGPFYYYMMAPALLLANFSPVGPAFQIALLGVVTIWFVWYVGRLWFNKAVGIVASLLYAISPTVIIYSRSSWNPNIMPFFALLSVYSIWKVWHDHKFNWLLVLGFAFAAVLQSHYLGLLLVPTLFIFWILTIRNLKLSGRWKPENGNFLKKSLFSFLIFLGLMSPLFFFDLRHNWINTKAFYSFFTVRQTTVSIRPWTAIPALYPQFKLILTRLVGGTNVISGEIASVVIIFMFIYLIYTNRKNFKKLNPAYYLIISWIGFGLIGFGLYKQNIYDHYYGFIFVVPFILTGIVVSFLIKNKKYGYVPAGILVGYLIYSNIINSPLKNTPNNQLQRAYDVAKKIEIESGGQRFNLGVIAERNYEDGYKYFLLRDGYPVIDVDSQTKGTITDQLFAVCELPADKCDPTHNATASIANFGWSKKAGQWEVDGVFIFKLIHSQ